MFKRWASFILILVVLLSTTTVFADVQQGPKVYNITVTDNGGIYQMGNVTLVFKKDFISKDMEPINFKVQFYAENGVPYIDIQPSVDQFEKKVMIFVAKGNADFYDIATNQTISINLHNNVIVAEHFSRYIIQD